MRFVKVSVSLIVGRKFDEKNENRTANGRQSLRFLWLTHTKLYQKKKNQNKF